MLIPQEGTHCERELDNQKKKRKSGLQCFSLKESDLVDIGRMRGTGWGGGGARW